MDDHQPSVPGPNPEGGVGNRETEPPQKRLTFTYDDGSKLEAKDAIKDMLIKLVGILVLIAITLWVTQWLSGNP